MISISPVTLVILYVLALFVSAGPLIFLYLPVGSTEIELIIYPGFRFTLKLTCPSPVSGIISPVSGFLTCVEEILPTNYMEITKRQF